MPRIAFSMTIDPDGAMHDWVDVPTGWSLTRVPTQEAVLLVGIAAYQAILVDLCETERPDFLVVHPPYDYLSEPTAARIRRAGTRVVGYAFDDEIFGHRYDEAVRARIGRIFDRYATTREVPWATAPEAPVEIREPEFDVVLVGRAYARRERLVAALRAAGFSVETRGMGWPAGFVSRDEMRALYARAAVVLTTADWEDVAVPMVKHRLLDTAMLGAFQVAQEAPDLRRYFPSDEVPSFVDETDLVARVREALADPASRRRRAAAARARALAEHTWSRRLPELLGTLVAPTHAPEQCERSLAFDALLVSLATSAESHGRAHAAQALFAEVLARNPEQPTAALGLGRLLRDGGASREAVPWLRRALAWATSDRAPACASAIHATIPAHGAPTGLGRLALMPPGTEAAVLLVAALVETDDLDGANRVLDGISDAATREAVGKTLDVGDDPELASLRRRLATMAGRRP